MDEMKCEWSGVKNVARTGIPFIKLDRIKVILYKYLYNRWILVQISKRLTAGSWQLFCPIWLGWGCTLLFYRIELLKNGPSLILPSSNARNSSAPNAKRIFQIL